MSWLSGATSVLHDRDGEPFECVLLGGAGGFEGTEVGLMSVCPPGKALCREGRHSYPQHVGGR